jgi:hypothetical protein
MADQTLSADQSSESICPWCSATIVPGSPTCPSCGAILESEDDREVPGLTAVDPAALRAETTKPAGRNRLLSWISGEYPEEAPSPNEAQALAPPDPDVQREMTRLALEAEVANLEAERDALLSEAVVEGRVAELPQDVQELATGEFDADTLAAATTDADGAPVPAEDAPASAPTETAPDKVTTSDDGTTPDAEVPPA